MFGATLGLATHAHGEPATLAVARPTSAVLIAPAYRDDRIEVQLRRSLSPLARSAYLASESARAPIGALGVPSIDRVAFDLGGVTFEPEFRGEAATSPAGHPDFTTFYIARLPPGVELDGALARFRSLPEVASAARIPVLGVSRVPNDSLFGVSTWFRQSQRHDIHAPEAWDVTTGDTSIVVAILDTGVLPYHPDLGGATPGSSGQFWTNWVEVGGLPGVDDDHNGFVDDFHGWDFVDLGADTFLTYPCEDKETPDNDPSDMAGHGTEVAGIVGALSDNSIGVTGTAWNVRLMPLRMGWANSSGAGRVDMGFAAQAIRYATRMHANVINCSFETIVTPGLDSAATEAARAGVIIVCASGNSGQFHELADREDVIAVAATDSTDHIAPLSNLGSFVDLAAPGTDIVTTGLFRPAAPCTTIAEPAYDPGGTGTSFSAPMVSGAIALVQARRRALGLPALDPINALLRLYETADDLFDSNPGLTGYGAGRLNLYRALTDPPGSSATRIGAPTIGPGVMLRTTSTKNIVAYVTLTRLLLLEGRSDTLRIVTLPGAVIGQLAAADLGGGLGVGLFVSISNARVAGFDRFGTPLPSWPAHGPTGSVRLTAGPAIADLDGDGVAEIVCGGSDGSIWAWHTDASVVTGFPVITDGSKIAGSIALSDLDGAPGGEIIASTTAGGVYAFDGHGQLLTGWPRTVETPTTSPVIGPLGFDPAPKVIIAAGTRLYAFDAAGGTRFSVALTSPPGDSVAQDAALGDLDGDGSDEIVVATATPNTIAVFDSSGAIESARGWPRRLFAAPTSAPVIGPLRPNGAGRPGADVLVMAGTSLIAISDVADSLHDFPKPGHAGAFPSLVDLEANGATCVLAGAATDSLLFVYDVGPSSAVNRAFPWYTARGNFARTGSRIDSLPTINDVPPAAVRDLAADSVAIDAVRLTWTATGSDSLIGRARAYEVRRALFPIDAANVGDADSLTGAPSPAPSGARERMLVGGLAEDVTYYFALRARDESGNASGLSNVAMVVSSPAAPGRVLDLRAVAASESSVTLRWTATGDNGPQSRPAVYQLIASEQPILSIPPPTTLILSSQPAGGTETFEYRRLARAHAYYFAVVALDGQGNASLLSNVVLARTSVGGPIAGIAGPAIAPRVRPSKLPVELYWRGAAGTASEIRIFDVTGRRVRTLPLGSDPEGIEQWNGRDEEGNLVPAGLYFARLTSGASSPRTRIVLLP